MAEGCGAVVPERSRVGGIDPRRGHVCSDRHPVRVFKGGLRPPSKWTKIFTACHNRGADNLN